MNPNAHSDYLTRKLAHYNEWLLDNKREVGVPYPGFPEDEKAAKWAAPQAERTAPKAEAPAVKKAAPAKKVKKAKRVAGAGPTKQELANAIFKQCAGDKAATVAQIQNQLNMTLAGATTYYYNARKA
jgi:hypothetical protein